MRRAPRYYLPYPATDLVSSPDIPWITIKFPFGLNGPPEIYCCADTFEETQKVREFIERALNHGNTEGSGRAPS